MPTATGRPTADEKRAADRAAHYAALRAVAAIVTTPEWVEAEAAEYKASGTAAYGTKVKLKREYPAGAEHKVGRRTVDEGEARAHAVYSAVDAEPTYRPMTFMSFGIAAGRQSIMYGVTEYRDA